MGHPRIASFSEVTSYSLRRENPTYVIRTGMPPKASSSEVEGAARRLSAFTRQIKAAFPRSRLLIGVRFYKGSFVSAFEFEPSSRTEAQKYMLANFKSDLNLEGGLDLLSETSVDTIPWGKVIMTSAGKNEVAVHAVRDIEGLVSAKAVIEVWSQAELLREALQQIYGTHAKAWILHPPFYMKSPPALNVWTGAKVKDFPSSGELSGFFNDVRELNSSGYTVDFPERVAQTLMQMFEKERDTELSSKARWGQFGFSYIETLKHNLNARGNGFSSYRVTPLPGVPVERDQIMKFFKGAYTPECGDSLSSRPEKDGSWIVDITRYSCD